MSLDVTTMQTSVSAPTENKVLLKERQKIEGDFPFCDSRKIQVCCHVGNCLMKSAGCVALSSLAGF